MQSPQKIALVLAGSGSPWLSCQIIAPNIVKAYERAFGGAVRVFFQYGRAFEYANTKTAQAIHEWAPDRVVFADHQPHPKDMIFRLSAFFGWQLPPIYVHAYGDFTLYSSEWGQLSQLRQLQLTFICASDAQASLLQGFLNAGAAPTPVLPFPVDEKKFYFDPKLRQSARRGLGMKEDEFAFVYVGRMSVQKNCLRLLKEFAHSPAFRASSARLYFVGAFDDMGAPFFGIRGGLGSYFRYWSEYYEALDENLKSRIHYLGNFNPVELNALYNAADCYTSLSLHHDEDYGMAPVEALACGNTAILSAWGGFRSFAKLGSEVTIIPVELRDKAYFIPSENIQAAITQELSLSAKERLRRRERISKAAHARYSIGTASERLRELHQAPVQRFVGFNQLLFDHSNALRKKIPFPEAPSKGGVYEQVYRNYYS